MADSASKKLPHEAEEERNIQLEERIRQLEEENKRLRQLETDIDGLRVGKREQQPAAMHMNREEELKIELAEKEEARKKEAELARDREEHLRILLEAKIAELDAEKEGSRKKDIELARVHKSPGGPLAEGAIEWPVEVAAIGEEPIYSPYTVIGGLPFRIGCALQTKAGKSLVFSICCNDDGSDKTFSAKAAFTLKLLGKEPTEYDGSMVFPSSECKRFKGWMDAVDPTKEFVVDGRFRIEVQIRLIWHYNNAFFDFSSPDPYLSDVILLVGGKEIHSNRNYLAHFSEYFKALLLSGFAEKDKKLVELPEFDPEEFETMLGMTYPQKKTTEVTKDNVEFLLRLADFFDVPVVRWKCIDFLMSSPYKCTPEKFKLADQYQLSELRDSLLKTLKDACAVQEIIRSSAFESYSGCLKAILRQKRAKPFSPPSEASPPCYYKNAVVDFSSTDPLLCDVILVAGETEFHSSKKFLAQFSGHFKSLFKSDSKMDRVMMEEVDAKELEDFLKHIYPHRTKNEVTKENVESLLRLAHIFDVSLVRWRCIDFLSTSSDLPRALRFHLSELYQLPELQDALLHSIGDASGVLASSVFNELSVALQLEVLKKGVENGGVRYYDSDSSYCYDSSIRGWSDHDYDS